MTTYTIYFTDLHCNKYSQFSEHRDRLKDCLKVIDDVFKYAQHYAARVILFGGDLGDLPKWIYVEVISSLMQRFAKWFAKCPEITMYAISGNHDQSSKNYWDKPAKTLLKVFATAFPDRFILLDNTAVGLGDNIYISGIPYYEHKACFDNALNAQVEQMQERGQDCKVTLLIHQTPEGIYNKFIRTETSPADPRYGGFDMVLCGHIHKQQRLTPKFVVGGNPLHRDLGDIGDTKGIWLLDLADPAKTLEFISRRGRYPEFVRMNPEDITEELKQSAFIIPKMQKHDTVVEGSADTTLFNTAVSPEDMLKNYWEQTNGTDQKLLDIGLSLLK